MLVIDADLVSKAFHDLATLLIDQSAQIAVLDTQKPLLVTALTDYGKPSADIQTTFTRDDTVSAILNAINASLGALSADPNYSKYTDQVLKLKCAIDQYFTDVNTTI